MWSRFPDSKNIAIDEIREKLYEDAKEALEKCSVGVEDPADDPDYPISTDTDDMALTVPYMRLPSKIGQFGFTHPYVADYQLSGYAW